MRRLALGLAALLAYFELCWPPFYDFAEPQPFRGAHWYDPYQGYRGGGLRANFHAHAEVWGGITFGDTPRKELHTLYREIGGDVVGISDYMSIAPPQPGDPLYLPAYEHGFLPGRRHQTVIGAERVDWFDYPLGASTRQKQHVIDRLRAGGAQLVVLNHPTKADSYTIADMERLSGYHAVEVATKYGVWDDYWDAALSAGRPIWGMAADDGHAQGKRGSHIGIGAVVLHTEERTPEAALRALRSGAFHSLYTRQNEPPIELLRYEIEDGALAIEIGERADVIRFISAHGDLRLEERGRSAARYRLGAADPYVRVEVIAHGAVLYTNPVLRWDGVALPEPRAELRADATWTTRVLGAVGLVGLAALSLRPRRRASSGAGGAGAVRNSTYPESAANTSMRSRPG